MAGRALRRSVEAALIVAALWWTPVYGQRGDRSDTAEHEQRQPTFAIPPSPALPPEEALKSFRLPPGFRIELVASEPLVEDPVAIAFDAAGKIWAVEMRGWMNDVDGAGNDQPIGRIVTLEDTDGDGRMDRTTVFMDGLVMPRAVQVGHGGVFVAAPPHLWFCRDTDGDGRADEKIVVADDYMNFPTPQTNVEADPNGLRWNLDNWLYSARYSARFRLRAGRWEKQPAPIAGQWGLTQDDYGRHFFNSNQDQLRANPLPAHYAARNPKILAQAGWNVRVAEDQSVWPERVTPAANRAYRPGVLRDDGRLRAFEAACGPEIYRGGLFPPGFHGNAFVAEPVANLVKRNVVWENDGIFQSAPAYRSAEFLASTDERFRPVNLYSGPDGALYVVDMYRGVIEYIHVMTSYLRKQITSRGLDRPLGLGRIYRIVPEATTYAPLRKMSVMSTDELARALGHENGWRREMAQRLLIERGAQDAVGTLRRQAVDARAEVARLHSLWTLEGLDALDGATLSAAVRDPSAKIRAAAVRLSEPWLTASLTTPLSRAVLGTIADPDAEVILQLALSLGEVKTPRAETILVDIALGRMQPPAAQPHPYLANAVLSGLAGRELEVLEAVLASEDLVARKAAAQEFLAVLAAAVARDEAAPRRERVFELVAHERAPAAQWVSFALLLGVERLPRKHLASRPAALERWSQIPNPELKAAALQLAASLSWPGKSARRDPPRPLTAEQRARLEAGKREYALCATCHLPTGAGMPGLAPALVQSQWVLGPPEPLISLVLHGKKEHGEFPPMPGLSNLSDDQVAAILTYVRREWGHAAGPIDPPQVAQVRQATRQLIGPLSPAQLNALNGK